MTEKKQPIVLKNVRLSYPSIRRPADSIDLMQPRGPSFTVKMPSKWGPFTFCWMMSSFMGGAIPAISAFVGHDPQKLLPPPGPDNRPMSLWDSETLLAMTQAVMYDQVPGIVSLFPRAAKPVRYYIDGGHFDMMPPGTVDPDDEWINFEGSPTGRRLAPFVMPMRQQGKTDHQHKVAVIHVGSDYGALEARILAQLADKRVRGVILDIESAGGEIINPQLDLYRMAFTEKPRAEKVAKKAPPAYLKHDPTKRHSRRRKGK